MNERRPPGAAAFATMTLLGVIWGMQQVAVKLTLAGISPVLQVGLRSTFAALLVFIWARSRGQRLFDSDGSLRPGLLVGLLFGLEFICIFVGLQYIGASRMVVFLYTAPCFTVLGLHWFVPGERIGWRHGFGVLLAFAGIVVAFGDGFAGGSSFGDALGVLAAMLWAATTVMIRGGALARVSAAKTLLYQLAVSAVMALPLSLLMGEAGVSAPTPAVMLGMLYQIVIVAFASYLTWFWLLTRYLANRLAVFSFLTPLFGVLFGVVLLGERMSAQFGIAALLVVAGIMLVNAPARR
jgi:drug/metabolite transporter (DMT)-like permease